MFLYYNKTPTPQTARCYLEQQLTFGDSHIHFNVVFATRFKA